MASGRVEISATVSEAVAAAFEDTTALQKEGSVVVPRDIAGARFVSRYHPRIREQMVAWTPLAIAGLDPVRPPRTGPGSSR